MQQLETQNFWQQAKHTKLYSNPFQAQVSTSNAEKDVVVHDSLQWTSTHWGKIRINNNNNDNNNNNNTKYNKTRKRQEGEKWKKKRNKGRKEERKKETKERKKKKKEKRAATKCTWKDSQLLRLNIRRWVLVLDHFFSVCLLRERGCSSKSVYVSVRFRWVWIIEISEIQFLVVR